VLECGAVEGQVFHRGAVQALAPEEPDVAPRLVGLVRKELVRPEQATFPGEDAYRFRHILIRDAAYDALPKATRAELHERFAAWLDERGDLVEQDEIVGYHLEQACRYRLELGPGDDLTRDLGRRAAERLAAAERAAMLRGDVRAAGGLLKRAVELLPADDPQRIRLLPELAAVLLEGAEFELARWAIDEALARATDAGDEITVVRARREALMLNAQVGGTAETIGAGLQELDEVTSTLERLDDRIGLAQAWTYLARLRFYCGDCAGAEAASERALPLIQEAGLRREEHHCYEWWMAAKRYGPTPVPEAISFADEVLAHWGQDGLRAIAIQLNKAALLAMDGQFESAQALFDLAAPRAAELGLAAEMQVGIEGSRVPTLAGDHEAAEALLRPCWDMAGRAGETGFRSTLGTMLAEALLLLGRTDETAVILDEVGTFVAPDDSDPQARLRWVRAVLLSARGEVVEAERLAREAVAIVDVADYLELRADAHAALASVLAAAGRRDDARAEWQVALDLYERKGAVVQAAKARERLAGVHAS
jgi:tetratricopeptide (TPR) repeat protein